MQTVAVIGAGLAGLACAQALSAGGLAVQVFDKGRGLGGRLATRRSDAGSFDHGAPSVAATGGFADMLAAAATAGHATPWHGEWTGLPGMSALVRPLAVGLTVHQSAEVTGIHRDARGWWLTGDGQPGGLGGGGPFDRLVLAIPQPQAARLVVDLPGVAAAIAPAAMRPVWTAMAAFAVPLPIPDDRLQGGTIALAMRDSVRPGRAPLPDRWVIHASRDWTAAHLELDRPAAARRLLPAFLSLAGAADTAPLHLEGHRWRFGLTDRPLGRPFVIDTDLGLGLCGDWCLGATAQDAFDSGRALAAALLGG